MEQKIADRIEELTNKINDLALRREELIRELRSLDLSMEVISGSIYELSNLLKKEE